MSVRLQDKYNNEITKNLTEKFSYKNIMKIPRLEKVVINMGVGEAVKDSKKIDSATSELASIKSVVEDQTKSLKKQMQVLNYVKVCQLELK